MIRASALAAAMAILLGCAASGPANATGGPRAQPDECPAVEVFAPGKISLEGSWQWRLTFSPTRLRTYWSHTQGWWPGTREQATIMTAHRLPRGGWSQPVPASFSGVHSDMDPFVSPTGLVLFFSSMRPVDGQARGDMDLWMVRRTHTGWGDPVHLGREVNADGYDELYPSIDLWGNLYFARVKAPIPTEDVDIWRSKRRWDGSFGPPEKLGAGVNTPQRWEFNPEISPDGKTLLFVRLDRPDDGLEDEGYGWGDLYASRNGRHGFGEGANLGPCVNTWADEFHPTVLWERNTLYFARDPGAPSDFYQTKLRLPR